MKTTFNLPLIDASLLITSATELISLIVSFAFFQYENYGGYNPMDIFNSDADIRKVLMQLINGTYSHDTELFRDLYNSLLNTQSTSKADTYFILKDFKAYAEAQKRVEAAYRDEKGWAKSAILNVALSFHLHKYARPLTAPIPRPKPEMSIIK